MVIYRESPVPIRARTIFRQQSDLGSVACRFCRELWKQILLTNDFRRRLLAAGGMAGGDMNASLRIVADRHGDFGTFGQIRGESVDHARSQHGGHCVRPNAALNDV